MAAAFPVLDGRRRFGLAIDDEVREPEERDLGAVLEAYFDERVLARFGWNHGMDATRAAGELPVDGREVLGLGSACADRDGFADEHAWAIDHAVRTGPVGNDRGSYSRG